MNEWPGKNEWLILLFVERFEKFYQSNKSIKKKRKNMGLWILKKISKIIYFVVSKNYIRLKVTESFLFPLFIQHLRITWMYLSYLVIELIQNQFRTILYDIFIPCKFYFSFFNACSAISSDSIPPKTEAAGSRIWYLNFMVRAP